MKLQVNYRLIVVVSAIVLAAWFLVFRPNPAPRALTNVRLVKNQLYMKVIGYGDDPARICIVEGKCPLLGVNELSDELTASRIQYGGVWYDVLWTAINPDYFPLENSDKELSISKLNGIFKSGPLPPDVVLLIKQKEAFIFWFPGYTGPNPIGIDVVSD